MGSKKGMPHRKWSKDEKLRYVRMHLEEHMPINRIEKEYGINRSLISTWTKLYLENGEMGLSPKTRPGNKYAALHRRTGLTEVERLRLIVAKQEVEIARLKKGYWVEGAGANKEYVIGNGETMKLLKNSE